MDLQLYLRVCWRFRLIVAMGFALAISLATLAVVRVDFDGLQTKVTYRSQEVWQSQSTLLITQPGFPWGRAVPGPSTGDSLSEPAIPLGDPARFTTLAALYTQLANGDAVNRILRRSGPVPGKLQASSYVPPNTASSYSSSLPLISMTALAPSPALAASLVTRGTDAFRTYLQREQHRAGIASNERVVVQVVQRATEPVLVDGRPKTLPAIVFLTVLAAAVGLAFVLENLSPRARPAQTAAEQQSDTSTLRSA